MNYRTKQLIERAVRRFTAFTSFSDLITCSLAHGYTPTIRPSLSHCLRDRIRIRALAQAYDDHLAGLGSIRKCYRGSDA